MNGHIVSIGHNVHDWTFLRVVICTIDVQWTLDMSIVSIVCTMQWTCLLCLLCIMDTLYKDPVSYDPFTGIFIFSV